MHSTQEKTSKDNCTDMYKSGLKDRASGGRKKSKAVPLLKTEVKHQKKKKVIK